VTCEMLRAGENDNQDATILEVALFGMRDRRVLLLSRSVESTVSVLFSLFQKS
jgi:hypothetical protein